MAWQKFIANLQNKPYESRVKILWSTVVAIGILLFIIWVMSLKSTINGSIGGTNESTSQDLKVANEISLGEVEWVESTANNLKIYFNFNNSTSDILNFSKPSEITLTLNGNQLHPSKILNRQGQPFVQKILSHTQQFGILVFPAVKDNTAVLEFSQMTFDQKSDQALSQKINLDLKALNNKDNLRD